MAVDITLTASAEDVTDQTTYTFANQAIGAAAPDRDVVVAVHWQQGAAAVTLSSATIAGVAATIDAHANVGGGRSDDVAIIRARPAGGTQATVVLNFSGGASRAAIDVYRVTGAETTLADIATDVGASSPRSILLDVPAEGGAIAGSTVTDGGGVDGFTWTNLTEDTDRVSGETANVGYSSAHNEFATEQVALAISVAEDIPSSIAGFALAGISFTPNIEEGVGSATGTATVLGVGASTHAAAGMAAGAATVQAVGTGILDGVGMAAGTSTATAFVTDLRDMVGIAAGTSTVLGFIEFRLLTTTSVLQKPVDFALAWRRDESEAATLGNKNNMSKALLKSIFRE